MTKVKRSWGIWVLGLALLLSSVGGAVWVVHIRAEDDPPGLPDAPAPRAGKSLMQADGVVCRGEVSVDGKISDLYPYPGQIVEIPVSENQIVKEGTVLLRLDDKQQKIAVRQAEAALQAARAELENAKKLPEQQQIQIAAQKIKIEAAAAAMGAAQSKVDRVEGLFGIKQADVKEVEIAKNLFKEAEANWRGQQEVLREIQLRNPINDINKATASVIGREATLAEANLALDHCTLTAPIDGMVLRIQAAKGEMAGGLSPRPPAIQLCPNTPRIVRVDVEQEYVGRVKEGMSVEVLDEIRVSGRWKGKVRRVGDYYTGKRNPEPLAFNDLRTLEAIVDLDPGQPPLKIGQRVRVVIGALPQN